MRKPPIEGAYEPGPMLAAMEKDGIGGAVVQATNTFFFCHWEDSEMIYVAEVSYTFRGQYETPPREPRSLQKFRRVQ